MKRKRRVEVQFDFVWNKPTIRMEIAGGKKISDFFKEFDLNDEPSLTRPNLVIAVNGEKKHGNYEIQDSDMVYFLNSRISFDTEKPDVVLEWLKFENYLRTAPWTQAVLEKAESEDAWMDMITDLTFRKVVEIVGFCDHEQERVISIMKTAAERWPDDKRFIEVSLWRKFNRAADVDFKVGEKAPTSTINAVKEDGKIGPPIDVAFGSDQKPVIIVSSSIT